jgi:multiple sugar transport system substrate-binding protein/sn-glycerol 3-phosphate transport system substrate-binding protein
VKPFSGLNQPLKRYLTLLYGITLGLALILALTTIGLSWNDAPVTSANTQTVQAPIEVPTPENSQVHTLIKPTELPEVPPTPNEVTPSMLGVTSADLRGIQVTLWYPWAGETGDAFKTMLDEYSRTNQWGITVNTSSYEGFGRLDEAVDSAIISDTLPDLLIDYGYQAQHWDESSILADLTPYVQDPLWGYTSGEQADFTPDFWAEDLVAGAQSGQARRLGIPFYRSAYVLFYNQSWARELGFTRPPSSMEDFRSQACSAANDTPTTSGNHGSVPGGWLITNQPGEAVGWIYAFGGDITNPDATGYLFSGFETRQAFLYIKDLLDKGCAWSDLGMDPKSEFANRGALFVVGSLFDIPAQQQAFNQAGSRDEWMVIPFPSRQQPVVDTYGPSILITNSTPTKQLAAWLVLKWLVYPHNQIDWVNGQGVYPTRQSATEYLLENPGANQQWNQALALLPDAHAEPSIASWSMVRWALNDAITELINPKLTSDQIPSLLEKLDNVALEINNQVP